MIFNGNTILYYLGVPSIIIITHKESRNRKVRGRYDYGRKTQEYHIAGLEMEWNNEPKTLSNQKKLEKVTKHIHPWGLQGKHRLVHTLVLVQEDLCQTRSLQNCKVINFCCFKPAHLLLCYNSYEKLRG